jgi:predicted patatin/cPLA2 family phospholipase
LNLTGIRPQETLDILIRRRNHGAQAGGNHPASSIAKVGLVIEGGGMRGVMSSAMVDALYQLGFGRCFDVVLGNSAGAMNAAYFLSGQITMGTSVYYEDLTGTKFIRFSRFPNFMDLDYLFNTWILDKKKLDVNAVLSHPSELTICTTRVDDGSAVYFGNHGPQSKYLIPALKASCSTPHFTRNVEVIDGMAVNDGLVHDAIPILPAIRQGCSHLLCIMTRPYGFRKSDSNSFASRTLGWLQTLHHTRSYRRALDQQPSAYNQILDRIQTGSLDCKSLLVIAPEPEQMIANGETDESKLRQAAWQCLRHVALSIDEDPSRLSLYDGCPHGQVL